MATVNELLGYTEEQYDSIVNNIYMDWCSGLSKSNTAWQHISANVLIGNYFTREFCKLEMEFLNTSVCYVGTKVLVEDRRMYYTRLMNTIYEKRNPVDLIINATKGADMRVDVTLWN